MAANPTPQDPAVRSHATSAEQRASSGPVARRHALRAVLAGALGALGAMRVGARGPQAAEASSTTGGIWLTGGEPNATTGSIATIQGDNTDNGGVGVFGNSSGSSGGGSGVYGTSSSSIGAGVSGQGATGVDGQSSSSSGIGVAGSNSSSGTGVQGTSASGTGVFGFTSTGFAGVHGEGRTGSLGGYFRTTDTFYAALQGDSANNSGGPGVVGNTTGGPVGFPIGPTGVFGLANSFVPAVFGKNLGDGDGVRGFSGTGTGVNGSTTTGFAGVSGQGGTGSLGGYFKTTDTSLAALQGDSANNAGGPGVVGNTTGGPVGFTVGPVGVFGLSNGLSAGVSGQNLAGGSGVLGTTGSSTSAAVEGDGVTIGVQGISVTTGSTTGYGVVGRADNGSGSAGILGTSSSGYGFYGFSSAAGSASFVPAGVLGYNTQTSGAGLIAYNGGAGTGYAAIFGGPTAQSGNVLVRGTLTMLSSAPSVAARDAAGALHRLYAVQSPDSWFEDFGSGQLSGGNVTVQLDPTFAQLVNTDDYHVFLTPEGDWSALYVKSKTAGAFTVSGAGGGGSDKPGATGSASATAFSYRVVAKRKDVPAVRLEPVAEPPAIAPPAIPQLPPPATKPQG